MSQPLKPLIPYMVLNGIVAQPEDNDVKRAKTFIKAEMDRIRQVLKDKVAQKVETPAVAPVEEPVNAVEDIVLNAPEMLSYLLSLDEFVQHIYIKALNQRDQT